MVSSSSLSLTLPRVGALRVIIQCRLLLDPEEVAVAGMVDCSGGRLRWRGILTGVGKGADGCGVDACVWDWDGESDCHRKCGGSGLT